LSPPRKDAPSDQPSRDRAIKDLGKSFLLEAGAGTGKTSVLLDRVAEILKTEVPLEDVAVITFTEKAAGELKLRLRKKIEEMLAASGPTTTWGAHLRRSLESLDRASVGTIHSFAASLLRERPVEAGVDPRFTVADELTASMLMDQTWERWLEQEMAGADSPLARALRLGVTLAQTRALAYAITENRDVDLAAAPEGDAGLVQARDVILAGIEQLRRLSASCVDSDDAGRLQIAEMESRGPALAAAKGDRLLTLLQRLPLKSAAGNQKNWQPASILAKVKSMVAELAAGREEACRRARTLLAHELALWLRDGFSQAYRRAKEDQRLLDFTDLLVICRNMLRDNSAARVAFQERFKSLLLDEFQDTDPLQAEIAFLLAADDPAQRDWRGVRVKPGKLFVVGDPKQSIYRFRRADIEIYNETLALIERSGGVTRESLTENFRTVPTVVAWVNEVFGKLIGATHDDPYQPAYARIAPSRAEPDRTRALGGEITSRVILLMPPGAGGMAEMNARQVRLEEARHVIALARTAVREAWPVCPKDSAPARPIQYSDIALLFRASMAYEAYEETLRAAQIPYRLVSGKRFYLRSEMRALQAVVSAIESPHDALAVVSALRCPIFGHSDEELLSYKAGGGNWIYTREAEGRQTPFEKSFDLMRRLHARRNLRPAAASLEELFEETGALSLFYLKADGDQRAANLLKAIDLARTHESAGVATFGSFARWLAGMAASEREEGEAPLVEEAEGGAQSDAGDGAIDAVRIYTVHKAKGLEFPMVILCDTAGQSKDEAPACVVDRSAREQGHRAEPRMEFRFGPAQTRFESAGYAEAAERETRRLAAERQRLFYVAATRARDYLIIPAFCGKRASGVHAALMDAGFLPATGASGPSGGGRLALHAGAVIVDGGTLDTALAEAPPLRYLAHDPAANDPALVLEKDAWRRNLQGLLAAPATGRQFRSASGIKSATDAVSEAMGRVGGDAGRARAVGIAVHAVLERIDLATGRDAGVMSEEEAAESGFPEAAGEVQALVRQAIDGRIVKEALASPRFFREIPFAAAGDTYLTEGRIDLVFESGGSLTIVDFKTDDVRTEAEIASRMEAYQPQALIYARALHQIAGLPVSRVVFFFIRPGVERATKVDETFLAMGRVLLETGSL
jgi:ATP-dependent exoDNAse (exonuclease V) beta subunit